MKTEVTTFCCGLSLKTGTIIIGTVQSIFAFIFLILSAAYAEHPHELIDMSDTAVVPEVHSKYRKKIKQIYLKSTKYFWKFIWSICTK